MPLGLGYRLSAQLRKQLRESRLPEPAAPLPCRYDDATRAGVNGVGEHCAGRPLAPRRNKIYKLRSTILHGSVLMAIDQDRDFGWDPSGEKDLELHRELWTVTRTAVRNWLRNPPLV